MAGPSAQPAQSRVRVLVVARTELARRLLKAALADHYGLTFVSDTEEALGWLFAHAPDLVVVESDAKGRQGLDACRELRTVRDVPMVLLAKERETEGVVRGLTCADEFLTLPVAPEEVAARLEAVLRRGAGARGDAVAGYDDGILSVDLVKRRVQVRGRDVALTPTEYRLLTLLLRHREQIVAQEELLERIWGQGYRGDVHLLRMQISHLRKKLAAAGVPYIVTYRGIGYAFMSSPPGQRPAAARSD